MTDDKIDTAISKIAYNLGIFGTAEVNSEDQAMAALSASAANPLLAGADVFATVRDIKHLLPADGGSDDSDDDDDDDNEDPSGGGGGDGGNGGGVEKPKKAGAWWAREAFVVKKETEMDGMVEKYEKALTYCFEILVNHVSVACACLCCD